jgi:hypothetical protein
MSIAAELRERCAVLIERRAALEHERAQAREINAVATASEQIKRTDSEIAELLPQIYNAERGLRPT